MNRRIISVLMVFLLLASVSIPTASAHAAPAVGLAAAAPETAEIVIAGITVVMSGIAALKIAENLGKTWDNTMKGWDQLMKDTSRALENLFHAKRWIQVTSLEGKAVMAAVYECWNAGGSSGGKKDDKWYFEARLHHGKIEINTELMNEEQAVKEMGRGKNIMTVDEELAKKVVGRYEGKTRPKFDFETSQKGREGYYEHLNFEAHNMRLHCWVWRP